MSALRFPLSSARRAAGALLFTLTALAPAALATDYYLGTRAAAQPGVALPGIAALNALDLQPGDRVFFQGGESFNGNLLFNSRDAGDPARPVLVTSFGSGRARILAGNGTAIYVENTGGLVVRGLDLVGTDKTTSQGHGVEAGVYAARSDKYDHLRFEQMRISGFRMGVRIWAWYSGSTPAWPGFRDVALTELEIFENLSDGINVFGTWVANDTLGRYSHSNFRVAHCRVYNNRGDPQSKSHTGSGIVISGVDGGVIEYNVAHDNGGFGPTSGGGPFGIWVWEANAMKIQFNLVYNQKTSSNLDGGAYDLDGGTSNSVLQYNYSYNNEGPAYGIIQFNQASPLRNNVVRYNISENDARRAHQGVIFIAEYSEPHGISGLDLYGNTVFVSTTASGRKPAVVSVQSHDDIAGVRIRNNLFQASHNAALVSGVTSNLGRAQLQGNNYWGGVFDLSAFRANGHELVAGQPVGSRVDPQLRAPGQGGAITDPTALPLIDAYQLKSTSPVLGRGLDLTALFGLDAGPHDFYGQPLDVRIWDVGAAHLPRTPSAPPPTAEPTPVEPAPIAPAPTAPPPPPPPTGGMLLHDDFTQGGVLNQRAPDLLAPAGAQWVIETGVVTFPGGTADTNNTLRATIDSGVADGTIATRLRLGSNGTGLILRSRSSSSYLRLWLSAGALTLSRTDGGTTTVLGAAPGAYSANHYYDVAATLAGPVIQVTVNGVPVARFESTFNAAATRHGLFSSGSGSRAWDFFSVSTTTSAAPAPAPALPEAEASPAPAGTTADATGGPLVADDFTGGGSLSQRSPDGGSALDTRWIVENGSVSIANGEAAVNNTARTVIETGAADATVVSRIRFGTTQTGLLLRSSNSTNNLRLWLSPKGVTLSRTAAGSITDLATLPLALALGGTYELQAVLQGSTITVAVDGRVLGAFSTTFNQTATRHGLFASGSGSRAWDSFSVSR